MRNVSKYLVAGLVIALLVLAFKPEIFTEALPGNDVGFQVVVETTDGERIVLEPGGGGISAFIKQMAVYVKSGGKWVEIKRLEVWLSAKFDVSPDYLKPDVTIYGRLLVYAEDKDGKKYVWGERDVTLVVESSEFKDNKWLSVGKLFSATAGEIERWARKVGIPRNEEFKLIVVFKQFESDRAVDLDFKPHNAYHIKVTLDYGDDADLYYVHMSKGGKLKNGVVIPMKWNRGLVNMDVHIKWFTVG